MRGMKFILAALLIAAWPAASAQAQVKGGVVMIPPITPNDCAAWVSTNILKDSGGTCGGGSGNVVGPASATDGDIPLFDGTTGKLLKNSAFAPASFAPAGSVVLVTGSNPTITAAEWAAFTQFTITGSGRTLTIPASAGLSTNGGFQIDTNASSVVVAANVADTITWNGATTATGASVTLPAGGLYAMSTSGAGALYISGTGVTIPHATDTAALLGAKQNWTAQQSNCVTPLTVSTTTFTPDGTCNNYSFTLVTACSTACTIANPSATPVAGTAGVFAITQFSSAKTLTWGTQYYAAGGSATVQPDATINGLNYISYYVADATHIIITAAAVNATH